MTGEIKMKRAFFILLLFFLSSAKAQDFSGERAWQTGSFFAPGILPEQLDTDKPFYKTQTEDTGSVFLMEGWPIEVGLAPQYPLAADLTGDGKKEIIIAVWGTGWLHVFTLDGRYLSDAWPKKLGGPPSSPAAADITGDGELEIIVVANGEPGSEQFPNGLVHVLKANGEYVPGWPVMLDGEHIRINEVSIGDINHDGRLNIITGTGGWVRGSTPTSYYTKLYAFNPDGTVLDGWPVEPAKEHDETMVPRSPKVLVDLTGDNHLEIVTGYFSQGRPSEKVHAVYAVGSAGQTLSGFPVITEYWNWALGAADMHMDGYYEILCHGQKYDRFGNIDTTWNKQEGVISPLAFADVNNDGYPDLIYGWGEVNVVDRFGNPLPGWPQLTRPQGDLVDGNPVAGDITGDGNVEILIGSYRTNQIFAWHNNGRPVEGFPVSTGDYNDRIMISDLDGDGNIELISACRDSFVYVWKILSENPCTRLDWPMFQRDERRTGTFPSTVTSVREKENRLPISIALEQNYPNPFNPSTQIRFSLDRPLKAELSIYNILGRKVKTLLFSHLGAGKHTAEWNGTDTNGNAVSGGVYLYRLYAGGEVVQRKMVYLR